MYVGDLVGAGAAVAGCPGDVDAVFGVGTAVPVHRVLHGQQLAVLVAADLKLHDQALAHEGGIELLLTRQAQLDRAALDLLGQDNGQCFHGDTGFGAEPTTNDITDHSDIALGDVQRFRD